MEGQRRLDNWEENKRKKEIEDYNQALFNGAGETDFSDEAKKRLEEASIYEEKLAEMAQRPSDYNPLDVIRNQEVSMSDYKNRLNLPEVKSLMIEAAQINELQRKIDAMESQLTDRYEKYSAIMSSNAKLKDLSKEEFAEGDIEYQALIQEFKTKKDEFLNNITANQDKWNHEYSITKMIMDEANGEGVEKDLDQHEKETQADDEELTEKEFDEAEEKIKSNKISEAEKISLWEKIKKSKIAKGVVRLFLAASAFVMFSSPGIMALGGNTSSADDTITEYDNDSPDADDGAVFSDMANDLKSKLDEIRSGNGDKGVEADKSYDHLEEESDANDYNSDYERPTEFSYEKHKEGDPIIFSQEHYAEIRDNVHNKAHIQNFENVNPENAVSEVLNAMGLNPDFMGSLVFSGCIEGSNLDIKNFDGSGSIDLKDSRQIAKLIKDMKENPYYYGYVYDTVKKTIIDNIENVEIVNLNIGEWAATYRAEESRNGESMVGINVDPDAVANPGEGLKFYVRTETGVKTFIIRKWCGQMYYDIIEVVVDQKKDLIVVYKEDDIVTKKDDSDIGIGDNDSRDPDPIKPIKPEDPTDPTNPNNPTDPTNPNNPDTPGNYPDIPITPDTPHTTINEAKNPLADVNVNTNLDEQKSMDEQRVDDGGSRADEDASTSEYNEPSTPIDQETTQQNIQEAQDQLNEQEEALDQANSALSSEEQNTITNNQTGQGEVQTSYEDVAKTQEEAVLGSNQTNQETVTQQPVNETEVNGF